MLRPENCIILIYSSRTRRLPNSPNPNSPNAYMLGLGLGIGVRNRVRVRVRDRFRDGVRDRMLGFGELGRNPVITPIQLPGTCSSVHPLLALLSAVPDP